MLLWKSILAILFSKAKNKEDYYPLICQCSMNYSYIKIAYWKRCFFERPLSGQVFLIEAYSEMWVEFHGVMLTKVRTSKIWAVMKCFLVEIVVKCHKYWAVNILAIRQRSSTKIFFNYETFFFYCNSAFILCNLMLTAALWNCSHSCSFSSYCNLFLLIRVRMLVATPVLF